MRFYHFAFVALLLLYGCVQQQAEQEQEKPFVVEPLGYPQVLKNASSEEIYSLFATVNSNYCRGIERLAVDEYGMIVSYSCSEGEGTPITEREAVEEAMRFAFQNNYITYVDKKPVLLRVTPAGTGLTVIFAKQLYSGIPVENTNIIALVKKRADGSLYVEYFEGHWHHVDIHQTVAITKEEAIAKVNGSIMVDENGVHREVFEKDITNASLVIKPSGPGIRVAWKVMLSFGWNGYVDAIDGSLIAFERASGIDP
ncbi:MAG: hypothetical protein QW035_01125 [Candidatus Anstonellales archaeon]